MMLQNTGKAFKIGRDHGYVYDFADSVIENEETIQPEISYQSDFRDEIDKELIAKALHKVLNTLSEREKRVLILRFIEGETFSQIGERLNVCKTRVSQVEKKALRKLRHPNRLEYLKSIIRHEKPIECFLKETAISLEIEFKESSDRSFNDNLRERRRIKRKQRKNHENIIKFRNRPRLYDHSYIQEYIEKTLFNSGKLESEIKEKKKKAKEESRLRSELFRRQREIQEAQRLEKERMKEYEKEYESLQNKRSERNPEEIEKEKRETNLIIRYNLRPTSFIASFAIYGSTEKKPDFFKASKGIDGEYVLSCSPEIGRYLPMLDEMTKQKWLKEAIEEYEMEESERVETTV